MPLLCTRTTAAHLFSSQLYCCSTSILRYRAEGAVVAFDFAVLGMRDDGAGHNVTVRGGGL